MSKRYTRLITPPGIAVYPRLNSPDTKYANGGPGVYKTDLLLDPNDKVHAEFIDKLRTLADEAHAEQIAANPKIRKYGVHYPFADEIDSETGDETGKVLVKVKAKAAFQDQKTKKMVEVKIPMVDAKRRPTKARVGGGSTLKLAVDVVPFAMGSSKTAGVSLRLKAVQIIDLVEYGGSFGFDEEDGFEADEEALNDAAESVTTKDLNDESDDEDDDF